MKRYILFGLLIFIGCVIAFMPAGILLRAVSDRGPVVFASPAGTIWRGSARLMLEGAPLGLLKWSFQATSVLRLAPGFAWQLSGDGLHLAGDAGIGFDGLAGTASGNLDATALAPWLNRYDIRLAGQFELAPTSISLALPRGGSDAAKLPLVEGEINWSGGPAEYVLSGQFNQAQLPPITAYLAPDAEGQTRLAAFARGSDIPLLTAGPGAPGFVKVGITKHFTKILGSPWPGSDPDHKIVIEVEEQLF